MSAPAEAGSGKKRRRFAAISVVLGVLIAGATIWFVVAQLVRDWERSRALLADAHWPWLLLAVPLCIAGMTSLGMQWRQALRLLGSSVRAKSVFIWYQIGMLGKYIPGGIMQFVGRGELATRAGVPRSTAYNSVALSMGATYLCGALVAAVMLPFALVGQDALGSTWWLLVVIPLGFATLHPRILRLLFKAAEKVFGGDSSQVPGWRDSLILVLRHVPGWLLNGLACWVTALAFVPDASLVVVTFAGIASWVGGFLVIFVPSGAGVREALFVALTAGSLGGAEAAAIAIVSRLAFVLGDILGALIASVWRHLGANNRSDQPA